MGKPKLKAIFRAISKGVNKNSPVLLMIAGIASGVGAIALTVKETIAAKEDIDDETEMLRTELDDDTAKLTPKEIFKLVWRRYISVAALSLASIMFLLSAAGVVHRRYESLSAAYGLLAASHTEYVDKVIDTIGENKERDIRDEIVKDKVLDIQKTTRDEDIIHTEYGDTLFVDLLSGRSFYSSYEAVRSGVIMINDSFTSGREEVASINDFYHEWGLPNTEAGELLGFDYHADGVVLIDFTPVIAPDGRTPAVGVKFRSLPSALYSC